jgi:signal transduction histidine kinase
MGRSTGQNVDSREIDDVAALAALQQALQVIATAAPVSTKFDILLAELHAAIGYDTATIMRLHGEEMRVLACYGTTPTDLFVGQRLCGAKDLLYRSIFGRSLPLVVDDAHDGGDDAQKVRQLFPAARSWLGMPLRFHDKTVGVFHLDSQYHDHFTPTRMHLILGFAHIFACALGGAGLRESMQQMTARELRRQEVARAFREMLAVLNSTHTLDDMLHYVAEQACAILQAGAAAVYRLYPDEDMLRIQAAHGLKASYLDGMYVPLGQGALGKAVVTRAPVEIADNWARVHHSPVIRDDEDPDGSAADAQHQPDQMAILLELAQSFHAILAIPLLLRNEVYGGLVLYYPLARHFTDEEKQLALAFADQAALVIENARLFAEVQDRAALAERQRLARDLHDAVTQSLFSASIIADVLPRLWAGNPEVGSHYLDDLRLLTRGALAEMRSLLNELRPGALTETDFKDLLRQLTEAFAGRKRVPVDLAVEGSVRLPPDVQIAFYRIAQEALNNIAKHAEATTVTVRFTCASDGVTLLVRDDGKGFDQERVAADHFGVRIMHERAQAVGASFEICSAPGQGTRVVTHWNEAR